MSKGRSLLSSRDYPRALLEFQNAAKTAPKDAEPYYQMGLTYLAQGKIPNAVQALARATKLNPNHAGAQTRLAGMMTMSRDSAVVQDAEERLKKVLGVTPDNADALSNLAIAEFQSGQKEEAMEHLQKALSKSPDFLPASVLLAKTRLAENDARGAEEALKQAVAQSPKSAVAALFLGELQLVLGNLQAGEKELLRALQLEPRYPAALRDLANLYVRAGNKPGADQMYQRLTALPEKRFRFNHVLYLLQSNENESAVQELERMTQKDPNDRVARSVLIALYGQLKRGRDVDGLLNVALKRNPRDADALIQKADLEAGRGQYREAERDLNQALHSEPNSAVAHLTLARVYGGLGSSLRQKEELAKALGLQPELVAARLELVRWHVRQKQPKAALELLDQTPPAQQSLQSVIEARNWAEMAAGNKKELQKGIAKVRAQGLAGSRGSEVLMQDAILKLSEKNYSGARSAVESALEQSSGDQRLLDLLIETYLAQDDPKSAVPRVREYVRSHPKSAPAQIALGKLLSMTGDMPGSQKAFLAAKSLDPQEPTADLLLAQLAIAQQDWPGAQTILSALLAAHPSFVPAELLWALAAERQGNTAEAVSRYRMALADDPTNLMALNNLSLLLANNQQARAAVKLAEQAVGLAPDNPEVHDTLGWAYYQQGAYSPALDHLKTAASKQPTGLHHYHLALAYLKAGQTAQCVAALRQAVKADPNLHDAKIMLDGLSK